MYDDPYVIDANTWRAGVKHVFAGGHELSGWGSRSDRQYAGLLRTDTLTRVGADTTVPVVDRGRASLDVLVRYGFFRNESTDLVESYRAHQVSIGLRVAF